MIVVIAVAAVAGAGYGVNRLRCRRCGKWTKPMARVCQRCAVARPLAR